MEGNKNNRVSIPLRMSNKIYKKDKDLVNLKKDTERAYSINKFIVEAIEEKLKKELK